MGQSLPKADACEAIHVSSDIDQDLSASKEYPNEVASEGSTAATDVSDPNQQSRATGRYEDSECNTGLKDITNKEGSGERSGAARKSLRVKLSHYMHSHCAWQTSSGCIPIV